MSTKIAKKICTQRKFPAIQYQHTHISLDDLGGSETKVQVGMALLFLCSNHFVTKRIT